MNMRIAFDSRRVAAATRESEAGRTAGPGDAVAPVTPRLLRLSAGVRGWMALGTLMTLAVTGTYVGQGIVIASAVERIFTGAEWSAIAGHLVAAVALVAVRSVLLWLRELTAVATGAALKSRLRRRLYTKLFELGPAYVQGSRTGAVQATVVDGVEKLDVYFSRFAAQFAGAALGAAGILAGLLVVDPVIGLTLLAGALAIAATPLLARRLQAERSSWFWSQWRRLGADHLDVLQGMTTLKAFDASAGRGRELARESWDFYRASIRFVAVANLRTGAMGLLSSGGIALAVGLGAVRLAQGALGVFDLLLVLLLAREAFRPLEELQKAYHSAYPALSAAAGVFELLDAEPAVHDPREPAPAPRSGSVTFENVTFAYTPGRPAVRNLSIHIDEGETVAFVGRSGAGKSTLVALLLRFFDAQDGGITLGGIDLRHLAIPELRRRIAVVAQATYLFHGSVRDNLLVGDPGADQSRLEDAARAAGAHQFIQRLPHGYDTVVGERGATLSGGERQRIAIARALLKDAPILVLDEATSSIDAKNEAEIQQALDRLAAGRTTLAIAHRLSTVQHADRIVLLDHGRITDVGTHAELLEHSTGYARLVAASTLEPSAETRTSGSGLSA
ncbi:ABC transporter ATP-binding protein [Jiangella aurantiaca]|uniref:ABC transporter ATP-binding protein n=1 Tax=Jiangella aurantiaca TaxID=2530373 RepID=A0A4V2YR15_9ACTN|nr:ABC transporter ATP-binding protein [Jiangella aurantiaca]TDD64027.1 ABC transporter ATP-binding protein [Jiangella aurantiaca]